MHVNTVLKQSPCTLQDYAYVYKHMSLLTDVQGLYLEAITFTLQDSPIRASACNVMRLLQQHFIMACTLLFEQTLGV